MATTSTPKHIRTCFIGLYLQTSLTLKGLKLIMFVSVVKDVTIEQYSDSL